MTKPTLLTMKDIVLQEGWPELDHQCVLWMLVGQICAVWQQVEHEIEKTIWRWSGLSQRRGMCFTAHMQFPLRCDVMRSLAHTKFQDPDYDKALSKMIEKELKAAKSARDRFAHAQWQICDLNGNQLKEKPSRLIPKTFKISVSLHEITGAQLKIVNAAVNFTHLINEFNSRDFSPETWPQKRLQPFNGYDQLLAARNQNRVKRDRRSCQFQSPRA